MTDTKETQALIESANASIKLLNGFIKSPTVYNGNPIVLRAFGHVKFYVENSITALQSQAEKDTQEPLQVIEGLGDALATLQKFKDDEHSERLKKTCFVLLKKDEFLSIEKAAKAYQQALEKQEKI